MSEQISEVDAVSRRLTKLGVPVAARVPDPDCDIAVEEVEWGDLYPRMTSGRGDATR